MCWQIETMAFGTPHFFRRTLFEGMLVWTRDQEAALRFDPIEDAEAALARLPQSDPAVARATIVEKIEA
jgi:hypothetical protein